MHVPSSRAAHQAGATGLHARHVLVDGGPHAHEMAAPLAAIAVPRRLDLSNTNNTPSTHPLSSRGDQAGWQDRELLEQEWSGTLGLARRGLRGHRSRKPRLRPGRSLETAGQPRGAPIIMNAARLPCGYSGCADGEVRAAPRRAIRQLFSHQRQAVASARGLPSGLLACGLCRGPALTLPG